MFACFFFFPQPPSMTIPSKDLTRMAFSSLRYNMLGANLFPQAFMVTLLNISNCMAAYTKRPREENHSRLWIVVSYNPPPPPIAQCDKQNFSIAAKQTSQQREVEESIQINKFYCMFFFRSKAIFSAFSFFAPPTVLHDNNYSEDNNR